MDGHVGLRVLRKLWRWLCEVISLSPLLSGSGVEVRSQILSQPSCMLSSGFGFEILPPCDLDELAIFLPWCPGHWGHRCVPPPPHQALWVSLFVGDRISCAAFLGRPQLHMGPSTLPPYSPDPCVVALSIPTSCWCWEAPSQELLELTKGSQPLELPPATLACPELGHCGWLGV